jgi:hypothetical protein
MLAGKQIIYLIIKQEEEEKKQNFENHAFYAFIFL